MKIKKHLIKKIQPTYDYTIPKYNDLKYLRICRMWIQTKYGCNMKDLETLLYLYSEDLFTKDNFKDYSNAMHRVGAMMFNVFKGWGYITEHRTYAIDRKKDLYKLTPKAKRVVKEFYEVLYGERPIADKELGEMTKYVKPLHKRGYMKTINRMKNELKTKSVTKL